MGDDTPLAVLSQGYRGLHHYFRQQFSQVTNPPIDSLRESRVMSLNTRLGNLTNVLDEDASQTDILLLSSPALTNADFNAMRERMGTSAAVIDCGFAADGDDHALRDGSARIRGLTPVSYDTTNKVPHYATVRVRGCEMRADKAKPATRAWMERLGYSKITVDVDYAYRYRPGLRELTIEKFRISGKQLGTLMMVMKEPEPAPPKVLTDEQKQLAALRRGVCEACPAATDITDTRLTCRQRRRCKGCIDLTAKETTCPLNKWGAVPVLTG